MSIARTALAADGDCCGLCSSAEPGVGGEAEIPGLDVDPGGLGQGIHSSDGSVGGPGPLLARANSSLLAESQAP